MAAASLIHRPLRAPSILLAFLLPIALYAAVLQDTPDPGRPYLSPVDLAISPNGTLLFVVCEDANLVLAVDTHSNRVVQRIPVGRQPKAITVLPDGSTIYVSNELDNTVSEIDAGSLKVRRTFSAGWGPVGLAAGRLGPALYVANTLGNDVSVLDPATGRNLRSLPAGMFPEYLAVSPDGARVYVANLLAALGPFNQPPVSEITVIDTASNQIAERIPIPGVIQLRHIAQVRTADGNYLLVPFMRPKNLNPLVQIEQGWYLTHGVAVIRPPDPRQGAPQSSRVDEVLLDDVDRYFADGFGAAASSDGTLALVTASGSNTVSIIDTGKLNLLLQSIHPGNPEALADRLDSAQRFVTARLPTGKNPTSVVIAPGGSLAYIANRMDDTITVVDLHRQAATATIDLGGPRQVTPERHGEQLFYDATYSFQHQMACATCHPHKGLSDGLAWSLETPELGRDVVENRTLRAIAQTGPFKWNGHNPDLETQAGPRTAMFIFRSQGFSDSQVRDLTTFIRSLTLPPNPRRKANTDVAEAQERGRKIFFRTTTNSGQIIPPQERCYFCHPPQTHYTARVHMDVGTKTPYDTNASFDIPQLEGLYMRAPYLHNGEALTLEEIWTKYSPEDKHGITSDMDKVQLNDLIEFLKTL
jgi:YVTN family beta-propeller protein